MWETTGRQTPHTAGKEKGRLRQQHARDAEGSSHLHAKQRCYCRGVGVALVAAGGGREAVGDFDALKQQQPAEVDEVS